MRPRRWSPSAGQESGFATGDSPPRLDVPGPVPGSVQPTQHVCADRGRDAALPRNASNLPLGSRQPGLHQCAEETHGTWRPATPCGTWRQPKFVEKDLGDTRIEKGNPDRLDLEEFLWPKSPRGTAIWSTVLSPARRFLKTILSAGACLTRGVACASDREHGRYLDCRSSTLHDAGGNDCRSAAASSDFGAVLHANRCPGIEFR